MNYADIKRVDVANGPGVRVSLFVSGCTHRCPGCFNPETWDFAFGAPFGEEQLREILALLDKPYIRGTVPAGGRALRAGEPGGGAGAGPAGAAGAAPKGHLVLHRLSL